MLDKLTGLLNIQQSLMTAAAVIVALVIHENCHAIAAYALGDRTAKENGRISLNPLKHLDPIGLIMLLVLQFGWAKPVMVDTRYFEKPKRDMAITAAAGPVSNFLLAFVFLIALAISYKHFPDNVTLMIFFEISAVINVGLGIFNLFPVPPLDGSKIFLGLLPDEIYYKVLRYERYGMLVLFLLLLTGIIYPPLETLRNGAIDILWRGADFITGGGRIWN